MESNKDRIENLEDGFGQLQDGIAEMKIDFANKFQLLEDIVTILSDAVLSGKGGDNYKQARRLMFYSKLTKLEFLIYHGDEDPTEWFTKVDQIFKNQGTPVTQKVSLASYHLQGEANQWWRWLRKAYQVEGKEVTWDIFYEELWSRFGPTDFEDFDEALLKALIGTFMGGLKLEIENGIRMFKPTNFKDATSLARVRDEQLNRLSPITQASSAGPTKNITMKRLKKRAQALSWDLSIGTRAMASNKDRIENMEVALGQLQDGIAEMKICFADKFQHLEYIITKLSDAVLSRKGGDNYKQAGSHARMRDKPLNRLSPITQASSARTTKNITMKWLTWDEMQRKRAQDGNAEMKISFADKFQHLKDIMTKLSDAVLFGKCGDNYKQSGRLMFYLKLTKLEFPTYRGDEDPTEAMASNKDQIEYLEVALGQLQDGIAEMKISFADKFQHLEDIIMKFSGKCGDNYKEAGRLMFYSKLT
ncbi:hypothetical protein Tco_0646410 [Tanacetum coccineum]